MIKKKKLVILSIIFMIIIIIGFVVILSSWFMDAGFAGLRQMERMMIGGGITLFGGIAQFLTFRKLKK